MGHGDPRGVANPGGLDHYWWRAVPLFDVVQYCIADEVPSQGHIGRNHLHQATLRVVLGARRMSDVPVFAGLSDDIPHFHLGNFESFLDGRCGCQDGLNSQGTV